MQATLIVSNHGDENSFNNSLIKCINRGSLLYPSSDIVHVALVCYKVFQKVIGCEEFLRSRCQRALTMNSILAALDDELLEIDFANECNSKHEPVKLVKMAVHTCTNVLLNNYCFVKNDVVGAAKLAKRRKLHSNFIVIGCYFIRLRPVGLLFVQHAFPSFTKLPCNVISTLNAKLICNILFFCSVTCICINLQNFRCYFDIGLLTQLM